MTPLLSTAFCPPVEYFAILAGYSSVYIEACESYVKQSWRNRCRILTANGPMDFVIPIVHLGAGRGYCPFGSSAVGLTPPSLQDGPPATDPRVIRPSGAIPSPAKICVRDVCIDYATPWVAKFRRAVESAYGSSPYYIYYADEFWRIFEERPERLWELNARVIDFLCAKIGVAPKMIPTEEFGGKGECWDLREAIHPKRRNDLMAQMGVGRPYWQVFREKFGFVEGLSVLDLLFNEGPESLGFLR